MKKTLGIVALLLAFTACKKDQADPNEPNITISKIYGTWNWVASDGGIGGFHYTPQSEHKT